MSFDNWSVRGNQASLLFNDAMNYSKSNLHHLQTGLSFNLVDSLEISEIIFICAEGFMPLHLCRGMVIIKRRSCWCKCNYHVRRNGR